MPPDAYGELMEDLETPRISPVDPTDSAYVNDRRFLLGPSADFSHPDFGLRENRPDENFVLVYSASHPEGNHYHTQVTQHVYDSNGNEVLTKDDFDHMCQPDMYPSEEDTS